MGEHIRINPHDEPVQVCVTYHMLRFLANKCLKTAGEAVYLDLYEAMSCAVTGFKLAEQAAKLMSQALELKVDLPLNDEGLPYIPKWFTEPIVTSVLSNFGDLLEYFGWDYHAIHHEFHLYLFTEV